MTQEVKIIVNSEVLEQVVQFVHKQFRRPKIIWFIFDVRRFPIANLIVEDNWNTSYNEYKIALTKCRRNIPSHFEKSVMRTIGSSKAQSVYQVVEIIICVVQHVVMGHAWATVESDYRRLFAIQGTHDLVPRLVDVAPDFKIYFSGVRIRRHDAVIKICR